MIGRSYLQNLWLSLSTPRYYLKVIKESLRAALLFLALSCVWLGILQALFFNLSVLPTWKNQTQQAVDSLTTPDGERFSLVWTGTTLDLSPDTPLSIPLPTVSGQPTDDLPSTFLQIVPTDSNPSDLQLTPTSTVALMTPTTLYVSDQQTWTILPLSQVPGFEQPFTISSETLQTWLQRLGYLSFLASPLSLFLMSVWSGLFNSVLVYFVLRLSGLYFKFVTVCKFSAHVLVASLIISQIQQWVYPSISLPLFSLSYWLYMAVIIFFIRQQVENSRAIAAGK